MSPDLGDQYRDSRKLAARAALHLKYGARGAVHDLAGALGWTPGSRVLDIGCGPGWFWSRSAATLPADAVIFPQMTRIDADDGRRSKILMRRRQ